MDLVRDLPPKDVVTVRANPSLILQGFPWSATQYFDLGFNLDKPPFNNVKVRQAVLYGMDREAMVKAVGFGSGAALLYPYWVPGSLGYDMSLPNYAYNADRAKQLLADAGMGSGIDFELKFIQREPDTTAAQLQQQVWGKLGIRVKLLGMERLAWLDDMKAKKFDVGIWRGSFPLDPDLQTTITTGAASNFSQFADTQIDSLMKEAGATLDTKQRAATYRNVLTRLYDQAYIGSGFQVPTIYAYRKNLRGLTLQFGNVDFRAAWKE